VDKDRVITQQDPRKRWKGKGASVRASGHSAASASASRPDCRTGAWGKPRAQARDDHHGRLICRRSVRRSEPPTPTEQTGNKRPIGVCKPHKPIGYRHTHSRGRHGRAWRNTGCPTPEHIPDPRQNIPIIASNSSPRAIKFPFGREFGMLHPLDNVLINSDIIASRDPRAPLVESYTAHRQICRVVTFPARAMPKARP
jgi:hypothetical protein